jgi:hypothetical protein
MSPKLAEISHYTLEQGGCTRNLLLGEPFHRVIFASSKRYVKGRLNRASQYVSIGCLVYLLLKLSDGGG